VLLALALGACHPREGASPPRAATPPSPRRAEPPAPALFDLAANTEARLQRWIPAQRMLAPFFAAVDGSMAALSPDGTLHWVASGDNGPSVREVRTPCRFDPSRHATTWTIAPRIALDGQGHACCVHDGDDTSVQGAYCADLRADPATWRRAHTHTPATGVGSGARAIAMFHHDLWCTTDGGAHETASFRGDESQVLSVASCAPDGTAIAVVGTHSEGAQHEQTVRYAPAGGALTLLADAPRGEPIDARVLGDGSVAVLLTRSTGIALSTRGRDGVVRTIALGTPPALALGVWGEHTVITRSGQMIQAVDTQTGASRMRIIDPVGPALTVAARVGTDLVGFGRDGAVGIVLRD
ncbi:MAG: hypothetical protein WCJ30_04460, partial [Deltaproteobacteria bacterium]